MANLYEYTDFRRFIVDQLEDNGRAQKEMAEHLGLSSSWASRMLSQLQLPDDQVDAIAEFLGLDARGRLFLNALVAIHSESRWIRTQAWGVILASREVQREADGVAHEDAWSTWYVPAVFALSDCVDFQPNPAWIAAMITPPITEPEALEALDALVSMGVVDSPHPTPQQHAYHAGVEVPPGQPAERATTYQTQSLDVAKEAFAAFLPHERFMFCGAMSVSEAAYEKMRALTQQFYGGMLAIANEHENDPQHRVYQVSAQFFPLSRSTTHAEAIERPDEESEPQT